MYTVTAEDNSERKYKVILVSPQSTGLPVIKIEIEGGINAIRDKENYIPSSVRLSDAFHPEYNFEEKEAGIRGRGNVTWGYPKKPYRLKFDKKVSMFGLGEAKNWVLLANYRDPTLIMNTVAFELGHKLELPYTNHANHVELFVNEEYRGSYVLTEQVQVNEYRVNIDEKKDFFVELDSYFDEDIKFKSTLIRLPVNVKSPEVKNESEIEFVKTAINNLVETMFGIDSNFPNNNYKDLIDIKSVIDFLIVNEVTGNRDLYPPNSTYMYKVENQKIHMGPLWDFDFGFGKKDGSSNQDFFYTSGMYFYNKSYTSTPGESFFVQFFKDPEFCTEYKKRWNEVKNSIFDMDIFIQEIGVYLQKSSIENKKVWTQNLDHAEQIKRMRTWVKERIASLDIQINKFNPYVVHV
jgi:spore coat protein CotH